MLIQNIEQMRTRSSVKVRVSPTLQSHRRCFKLSDAHWCCLLEGVGAWADSPFPLQTETKAQEQPQSRAFLPQGSNYLSFLVTWISDREKYTFSESCSPDLQQVAEHPNDILE